MSDIKIIRTSDRHRLGYETFMVVNGINLSVVDVFGRTQVWIDGECFHEQDWTPAMWDCVRLFRKMLAKYDSDIKQAKVEKRKAILAKLR